MKKKAIAITVLVAVTLVAVAGVMVELSVLVPFAAAVKIGIETEQLNQIQSAQANLPPMISLAGVMSGPPSSMTGGLVVYPVLNLDQLSSCGTSVTGTENRAANPIVVMTEEHACVGSLRNVTVIVTAYLLSGHITVKVFSADGLLAVYDGSGNVTLNFGCDMLSNRHTSVKPPGL